MTGSENLTSERPFLCKSSHEGSDFGLGKIYILVNSYGLNLLCTLHFKTQEIYIVQDTFAHPLPHDLETTKIILIMGMIGRTNTIILFCSKVYVGFTLPNEFEIAKRTLIMDMAGRTNNFFLSCS